MKIELLSFGIAKDILGNRKQTYLLDKKINNIGDLRKHLIDTFPKLKRLNSLSIACNEEYVDDDFIIKENAVIALIPPVSGG